MSISSFRSWEPAQQQLAILGGGVAIGAAVGLAAPGVGDTLGWAVWPLLTAVLYVTFLQVHVRAIPEALRNRRFLVWAMVGNFVVIPALVGAAVIALPLEDAVRVGVLLVLLAPCTDWFTSFTHLGKGDTRLAIALTPLLLLAQFAIVPFYVWALGGITLSPGQAWPVLMAFGFVVALPMAGALLTQRVFGQSERIERAAGHSVVPLLAATLFIIAASEARTVADAGAGIGVALAFFIAFAVAAALVARSLAGIARLPTREGRTLAFNLGSRNSFVVLPIALTLPAELALAAPVVAAQSLVELVALLVYVRWVPARLFPADE
jgi:ACR3 family arsenite efflux pump ArsB